MVFEGQGEFRPYNDWIIKAADIPSYDTLAVGCNGILYPPGSLPKETFDKDKILELSLNTDDLWLKCMEVINGWKVVNCNLTPLVYFSILSTGKSGLWKDNTSENNDVIWGQLMKIYPEVKDRLIEEREHG